MFIRDRHFCFGEKRTPAAWGWFFVKRDLLLHLRNKAASALAERRPLTFGGLGLVHRVAHMTLLKELPHYEASLMMRIWTGAVLTREKTGRMGLREDDHCECGAQTLWHSLWECELQPMVPPDLVAFARLPPARSVACLLPFPASHEECVTWRKALCTRASHNLKIEL